MKKPNFKQLAITGILLIPLVFLAVYTFKSNTAVKKGSTIPVSSLKLSTPADTADEIASYIRNSDYETALVKIDENLKDPNIPTSKGEPLLLLAVEKNNYDIAAVLVAKGSDANFADINTGETPLIKAAQNGNIDMMNLLVVANANVNAQSKRGITPLTSAVENKNSALTDFLIARGARAGVSQENLLNYAFQRNFTGIDAMLKGGANPNFSDNNGNTPLMVVSANGDLNSFKALMAYRAEINTANKTGMTALIYAIKAKRAEIVKELLDRNTDINKANNLGETALYWAAYLGNTPLVDDLLKLGADYKKVTNTRVSAEQIATKNGHAATAKLIKDFIAYQNLPKDKKGRIIVPKKKAASAANTSNSQSSAVVQSGTGQQPATGAQAGAMPFDMTSLTGGMPVPSAGGIPPQAQAQIAAAQAQAAQVQAAGGSTQMQPKNTKQGAAQKEGQKTIINKLRTSSL